MADIMGLPLTTARLTIRRLVESDWDFFADLHADAQVMEHVGETLDETAAKQLFEQRLLPWQPKENSWLSLVIQSNDNSEIIGFIGLKTQNIATGIVEVGFILDSAHSGQGYGSEALGRLIKYAFYNLEFHKITATCSIHNVASQKVLGKNGFVKEGILRHNTLVDDHYVDDCIYGLLIHDLT